MARSKYKSRATRCADAIAEIQSGLDAINELKDEIENWRDGLQGTNLENSDKYDQLESCIQELEQGADEIESGISSLESAEFPTMYS